MRLWTCVLGVIEFEFLKWVFEKRRIRRRAEVGSTESKSFVLLLRLYMVVVVCKLEGKLMCLCETKTERGGEEGIYHNHI